MMIHSERSNKLKEALRKKIRPLMTEDVKAAVQASVESGSSDTAIAQFITLTLGGSVPWAPIENEIAGEVLREEAA